MSKKTAFSRALATLAASTTRKTLLEARRHHLHDDFDKLVTQLVELRAAMTSGEPSRIIVAADATADALARASVIPAISAHARRVAVAVRDTVRAETAQGA